jgi:GNAT superfamily N-acetyltransferase
MQIKTEQASVAELELILPLVRDYHAFEHIESSESDRESAIRTLLATPAFGGIWLVYCADELAGYIALCLGYSIEFNGFDGFIDEFYLGTEYRGQGVGTQVLEIIKREARLFKVKALHLEVARDNVAARSLYGKAGFAAREKYMLMSATLPE